MKQNQQNKHKGSSALSLGDLRRKIDKIDDELVRLLKERMSVVKEVGELKERSQDSFFIKSAREADMMKNLMQKTKNFLKAQAVFNIWRSLITSANILEQKITAYIYNPNQNSEITIAVNNYYGNLVETIVKDDAPNLLKKVKLDKAAIVAVLSQNDDDFWQEICENHSNLQIFAKISQKISQKPNVFLLAKKMPEKSMADNSVIYLESNLDVEKISLFLTKNDLKIVNILELNFKKNVEEKPMRFLVEVEKFYQLDDKKIVDLQKQEQINKLKILGYYPR